MMMSMEQSVKYMAGENRRTRRKHVTLAVFHHKSHMTISGLEPGPPLWEAGD
jgi:hypothetical protein